MTPRRPKPTRRPGATETPASPPRRLPRGEMRFPKQAAMHFASDTVADRLLELVDPRAVATGLDVMPERRS